MNKTTATNEQSKSSLERFKLFYEHTDDNRVVVDAEAKPVKQPRRNILSKH